MANATGFTHIIVKDKGGNDYLCPVGSAGKNNTLSDLESNECFEKDVAERYAGNISVEKK